MIYIRGHQDDYNGWRDLGNSGWGWDDVLPYFKRAEDRERGANALRGAGGPLHIAAGTPIAEHSQDFIEATAAACGVPKIDDFNRGDPTGAGLYEHTVRNGRRFSTAVAYLDPVLGKPNLTLVRNSRVIGLILEGGRAVGVREPRPMPWGRAMTIYPGLIYPKSTGEIVLRSKDPIAAPAIEPRYFSSPEDLEILVTGVKLAREIAATAPLARWCVKEITPGRAVNSDQAIRADVCYRAQTVYHPVGTCRMGHDQMAVVDERLRVRGIDGLRVVDASVMPCIIGGNTNGPTIMIGEKAADMIQADR